MNDERKGDVTEEIDDVEFTKRLIRPGGVGVNIGFSDPRVQLAWATCGMMEWNLVNEDELGPRPEKLGPVWDVSAWSEHVAGWKLGGPFRISLGVKYAGCILGLRQEWIVVDSESKGGVPVGFRVYTPIPTPRPNAATDLWIRAVVLANVMHEVDEFTLVRGEQIFNPHPSDERPGTWINPSNPWIPE